MTELIRFNNWIIDRNEIKFASIHDDKKDTVVIELKCGKRFTLNCENIYNAQDQLNHLTAEASAKHVGTNYDHYLSRQMISMRVTIQDLEDQIKKLMKKFSSSKKKLKHAEKRLRKNEVDNNG